MTDRLEVTEQLRDAARSHVARVMCAAGCPSVDELRRRVRLPTTSARDDEFFAALNSVYATRLGSWKDVDLAAGILSEDAEGEWAVWAEAAGIVKQPGPTAEAIGIVAARARAVVDDLLSEKRAELGDVGEGPRHDWPEDETTTGHPPSDLEAVHEAYGVEVSDDDS